MRPWQARKEKSQTIRKVKGRILYGRDGSSVSHTGTVAVTHYHSYEQVQFVGRRYITMVIDHDGTVAVTHYHTRSIFSLIDRTRFPHFSFYDWIFHEETVHVCALGPIHYHYLTHSNPVSFLTILL